MLDDFSALDLLSMGGFKFVAADAKLKGANKRSAKKLAKKLSKGWAAHHKGDMPKQKLAALLPLLGRKFQMPSDRSGLQGWPVTLSWPTKEMTEVELWPDQDEPPVA